jgi:Domain of unknown function (DUF4436)
VPRVRLLIILLIGFLYVSLLVHNLNESARRSLQVHEDAAIDNYVRVIVRIVDVDVAHPQVKVRMNFRPVGDLAKDKVTPARNLKLFLNALHGSQEIDFPAGRPMNPVEADFPLEGDSNKYPFDSHRTTLWLLLTTPIQVSPTKKESATKVGTIGNTDNQSDGQAASGPTVAVPAGPMPPISDLMAGVAAMAQRPVPILIDVVAAVPGIKFSGGISRTPGQDVTGIDVYLRRTDNVIMVSICVMAIMMCLAISLIAMVVHVKTAGNESTLLPLSLSVSLIFGLPALRNMQPSVPPVGVFGDYVSFVWAELIVAISTAMVVWTWIAKARKPLSEAQSQASPHKT